MFLFIYKFKLKIFRIFLSFVYNFISLGTSHTIVIHISLLNKTRKIPLGDAEGATHYREYGCFSLKKSPAGSVGAGAMPGTNPAARSLGRTLPGSDAAGGSIGEVGRLRYPPFVQVKAISEPYEFLSLAALHLWLSISEALHRHQLHGSDCLCPSYLVTLHECNCYLLTWIDC